MPGMPGMPGTILESKEIMINKIAEDVATILPRSSREEGLAAPAAGHAVSRGPFTSHVSTELPRTRSHLSQGGHHAMTDQSQKMKTWPSLHKSGQF